MHQLEIASWAIVNLLFVTKCFSSSDVKVFTIVLDSTPRKPFPKLLLRQSKITIPTKSAVSVGLFCWIVLKASAISGLFPYGREKSK